MGQHIHHAGYAAFSPVGPTGARANQRAVLFLRCPRHVVLGQHTPSRTVLLWSLSLPGKDRASFRNRREKNREREEIGDQVRSGPMNGGGRRRTERFGCGVKDNPIINQIMLRFRPIAPKPDGGDSPAGPVPAGNKNLLLSVARKKRKYTRVRNRSEVKRSTAKRSEKLRGDSVVTLQLLPERTESREGLESRFLRDLNHAIISEIVPGWGPPGTLGFSRSATEGFAGIGVADPSETDPPTSAVESSVTVERVTDTCMELDAPSMGGTDVERLANLERDTCPGFVSDGRDEIQWINPSYRKLLVGNLKTSPSPAPEITARLVTKEKLPHPCHSFACRVTLQYTWRNHDGMKPKAKTLTVPCDVWKMDRGGFAWRLDINAALSLGL